MNNDPLIEQLTKWHGERKAMALATVIETWGSSPCPSGSKMVVNDKGAFVGSVSGGCIETSVVSEAIEVIRDGVFDIIKYGISDEQGAAAALACGGTVRVLVERIDEALFEVLTGPRPVARIVDLGTGQWTLEGEDTVQDFIHDAIARGRATIHESAGSATFIDPLISRYRLLIIGATAIAQALVPMALVAGFDVSVIDPRLAFASKQRFPVGELIQEWPDKAIPDLSPDTHTAVVTLTHDSKPDDMALELAVRSTAFYVGALGSRKTHAQRLQRMKQVGIADDILATIHAPIGLPIGGRTPADIAISILAQIIAVKNGIDVSSP